MKSRRFVLAAALGLAATPILTALPAEARTSRPSAVYKVDSRLQIHFSPASDAAAHYRELGTWLRVLQLREKQYRAQVQALDVAASPVQQRNLRAAVERHQGPWNIAVLRFLLATLAAEGNQAARALDLTKVGVEDAVTRSAQPLIQAGYADARAKVKRYRSRSERAARQARLALFTEAQTFIATWLRASEAGTPITDHAPYVPFYLGGDFEMAMYASLYPQPEEKPVAFYWEEPGTEPIDVAKAKRLSDQNKAYFDGLASLDSNPLVRSTY